MRTFFLRTYLSRLAHRPPRLAPALGLSLGLSAGLARAEQPKAETPKAEAPKAEAYALGWSRLEGAEQCIGSRELAVAVETSLKRRVFAPASRADRSIDGRISPRPEGGFHAVLQLSDATGAVLGSRELSSDGPDCRTLDEALTLSLSLLLDPDAKSAEPEKPATPAKPAASAPPPSAKKGAPDAKRFEVSATVGYVTGDQIFPREYTFGDGLGVGLGVRAGYTFSSKLWLGGSYTFYTGGHTQSADTPGILGGDLNARQLEGGRFQAHILGPEIGYSFSLGPLEVRPYVGAGLAVFAIKGPPTAPTYPAESSPVSTPAAWPGVALTLPFGDTFFAGADMRWQLVQGAPAQNNVGAFAFAGMRF